MSEEHRRYTRQVIGSLLAALVIVALTIAVVTANVGEGLDPEEIDERQEELEERREKREDRLED